MTVILKKAGFILHVVDVFVFRFFFKCEPNFSMLQDNYCHLRNTFGLFWEATFGNLIDTSR